MALNNQQKFSDAAPKVFGGNAVGNDVGQNWDAAPSAHLSQLPSFPPPPPNGGVFGAPGDKSANDGMNESPQVRGGFGLFGGKRLGFSPNVNFNSPFGGAAAPPVRTESVSSPSTLSSLETKPRNVTGKTDSVDITRSLVESICLDAISTSEADLPAPNKKHTPGSDEKKTTPGKHKYPPPDPLQKYVTLKATPPAAGPEDKVTVVWEMPEQLVAQNDWVGIYRIHQRAFTSCMTSRLVSKNANRSRRQRKFNGVYDIEYVVDDDPELPATKIVGGTMVFHAPPAIGRYDFRLYQQATADRRDALKKDNNNGKKGKKRDSNEADKEALPLVRSNVLTVEAQGLAFVSSLRFLKRRLEQSIASSKPGEVTREYLGSLNQLVRLLEQLRDDGPGRPLTYAKELFPCVTSCWNKSKLVPEPKQTNANEDPYATPRKPKQGDGGDEDEEKDAAALKAEAKREAIERERFSLHKTTRDILLICKINPTAARLFGHNGGSAETAELNNHYHKYWNDRVGTLLFASDETLVNEKGSSARDWAFIAPSRIPWQRVSDISTCCKAEAAVLIPPPSNEQTRLELRSRLENILRQLPYKGLSLGIFGSSLNNFGTVNSDLDMCLQVNASEGENSDLDSIEKQRRVIEQLAELLPNFGMRDIDTVRITARIPIIQFVDEKTGIECDVCVNNPLALRNTRLMRSYSLADIRVREVAYMIKKWSKRRDINDPARSTLSSYGYILTVINSLQHGGWVDPRKAKGGQAYSPLLNNLQHLQSSYAGDVQGKKKERRNLPSVMVPTTKGDLVDSYFFDVSEDDDVVSQKSKLEALHKHASRCQQTVGRLLLEYFWHFAFVFNWRRQVVQTQGSKCVLKHSKARDYGWKRDGNLSIEDPFEKNYNVAHVLRPVSNKRTREEFVRAYCILAGIGQYKKIKHGKALELLFEKYIEPVEEEEENDVTDGGNAEEKKC